MKRVNVIVACVVFMAGCKEPTDLASIAPKITSVTVYDVEGLHGLKYMEADLNSEIQTSLDVNVVKNLFAKAKFKNKSPMWKGSSLAIVKMSDGTEKRLALSYYAAFFSVLGEKGYFRLEENEDKQKFRNIMNKIIQDDFIPKRIDRNHQIK